MAEKFGSITGFRAKNTFNCKGCEDFISPKDLYILVTVLQGTIRKGTNKWHLECWLEHFNTRMENLNQFHISVENHTEIRTTRLKILTPAQRYRRKVLQTYITTRDIPALKKAYEQHSTERVIKVMQTISNRWEEFAEMGIKPKGYLWKDKQVDSYIATYDWNWMTKVFKEELTLDEQVVALRRSLTDEHLPRWPKENDATN